ncbi:TetR/AcrR family transcriptional regulator [uncultured Methanobacterium sp.]|uniref:TetR/AcrR family transcriptional regulator n=1 Tax=uncultured Methanobacterium sp. TaxID=176306 RepID=UPI002AA812A1|nr:TetR/AcrR family transcriptional regulator [uncultured Methanobacterium sp.]
MSIKEIRKREKKQRRDYILNVAEELFFSKGYDDVSMNQIAQDVGLNKATLYLYFKNKESIYFAIVLRGVRIFKEILKNRVELGITGIGKLEEAGRAYFAFYKDYHDYHDAYLYYKSKRFQNSADKYAIEIESLTANIMIIICNAIQEGIKDKTIRENVKPIEVAVFVAVTAERIVGLGPSTLKVLESQGITHEQFIEDSMDLWKHMVMEAVEK